MSPRQGILLLAGPWWFEPLGTWYQTLCTNVPGTGARENRTGSAWKFAVGRFAPGRSVCKTMGSLEANPAIK